ncbi:MAG: sodium:proton antiporter [Magnetococcales bacterium]|nr:sodium:proton antiporter [Magnetococcales bacterium]
MSMTAVLALLLFAVVFVLVEREQVDRQRAMLVGALLFLLLGWLLDFYPVRQAVQAIYFDTLALIFGMSLITHLLSRAGLFRYLAFKTAWFAGGNGLLLLVLFVLVTYTLSLVVNNLGTMLIILPLTLASCRMLNIDAVPIVAAELIASNLGGASTLTGDFPNMIIGAAARLHFDDFIAGMMVPCLLLLAVLLLYFQHRVPWLSSAPTGHKRLIAEAWLEQQDRDNHITDPHLSKVGLTILTVTLVCLITAEWIGLQPSTIAFVAGLVVLATGGIPREELVQAVSGNDIGFFVGLFVMVGGLQAAGVLEQIHQLILLLGGGYATLSLLVLMWVAGLVTPFLNAGPTTAFFIPIAQSMSQEFSGSAIWWALSLGVLAGSSATLSGATAGPVVASQMAYAGGPTLSARRYLQWGVPMATTFLLLSTVYIVLIGP